MKAMCVVAMVLWMGGCKSDEEKMCNDPSASTTNRVSACGQECDRGHGEGCATQTKVGLEACMTKKDAETCRWMCLYAKDGKDLYCAEFTKQTGKDANGL